MSYAPTPSAADCKHCKSKLLRLRTVKQKRDKEFQKSLLTYVCAHCDRWGQMHG